MVHIGKMLMMQIKSPEMNLHSIVSQFVHSSFHLKKVVIYIFILQISHHGLMW